MAAAQHIVKLNPIAVELIDRTMLCLARAIAMFKPTVDAFLRGDPEAILFVEFAEDDAENARRLKALAALIGRLYGPITSLSNVQVDVMTALVSFDRVFEVLDLKPLIGERPGAEPKLQLSGRLARARPTCTSPQFYQARPA